MTVKVTYDRDLVEPPVPAPTWQPDLFYRMFRESLAEQGELFPGFQGPEPIRPRPPDAPGQGRLFE
jgi:hypothetical protein